MKRVILASMMLAALAGGAAAADLPPGPAVQPYYKAPAYGPAFNWSGFYIGVNGGGAWGRSDWSTAGGFDLSGGEVGGTAGFNYQAGAVVFGVEGDIDWARIDGTSTAACAFGCTTSDSWLATVRGRLGYAADRFMPYVTGGLALGDIRANTPFFAGNNATNAGWTIGAGLEFAFAPHWSAKAEYLYVDLGNFNCGLGCGFVTTNNVSFRTNLLRAGINYHF